MRARVGKHFTFHAAHQLPNHDGLCRNLHGHTYKVEIIAQGHIQGPGEVTSPNPKEGMVLDFGDLKATWQTFVEPLVDHTNLNETLPIPVTTAENIAGWMYEIFKEHHAEVIGVRVWETPTSWAEVNNGDVIRP